MISRTQPHTPPHTHTRPNPNKMRRAMTFLGCFYRGESHLELLFSRMSRHLMSYPALRIPPRQLTFPKGSESSCPPANLQTCLLARVLWRAILINCLGCFFCACTASPFVSRSSSRDKGKRGGVRNAVRRRGGGGVRC